mgnify:CR=1 FL=1
MGLDMYAYVASRKGQQDEFYETAEFDKTINEFVISNFLIIEFISFVFLISLPKSLKIKRLFNLFLIII